MGIFRLSHASFEAAQNELPYPGYSDESHTFRCSSKLFHRRRLRADAARARRVAKSDLRLDQLEKIERIGLSEKYLK